VNEMEKSALYCRTLREIVEVKVKTYTQRIKVDCSKPAR
jgi:hypothetical protein